MTDKHQKRWEFVLGDEITIATGRTVKRIRALVAIAARGVAPGDLGGYVEKEVNLAEVYGDAWVSGNARVYGDAQVSGNARVYGDAQVSGDAEVSGDAWVSGNARVYGDAQVSGDAEVSGDAWVSGNARVYGDGLIFLASKVGSENGTLTVYNTKANTVEVTRGCFRGSVAEFLAASAAKHDARIKREYELLIEVATSRIEAAREGPEVGAVQPVEVVA